MAVQSTVLVVLKDGTRQSLTADSVTFSLPNGSEIEASVLDGDHIASGLNLSSPQWDPIKLQRTSFEPTIIVVRPLASDVISVDVEREKKVAGGHSRGRL
jgi:hypothetical protein